ncbi:hypothetical protein FRC03_006676 [Tulasnella sp. 419]|nr:hypothetical protein FRC03_006676 [Tulasnella sp. 419]
MAWNPGHSGDLGHQPQQHQHTDGRTSSMLTGTRLRPSGLQVDTRNRPFSSDPSLDSQRHHNPTGVPTSVEDYEEYALSPVTSASASSPSFAQARPGSSLANISSHQALPPSTSGSVGHPTPSILTSPPSSFASPTEGGVSSARTRQNAAPGKRKRSRVTPEQLSYLERVFAIDPSPGAVRRKEISELLGMGERQTQIWFQNRRAKEKMLRYRGRGAGRGSPLAGDRSPISPPDLGMASNADLESLIHAEEPITIIECRDLTVGSWHRIASKTGVNDLIAYTAEKSQTLTWYIHCDGYGFKMDIPFSSIIKVDLHSTNDPRLAQATITLSTPPRFSMEADSPPDANGITERTWKKCSDWTEGMQATKMLRHEVIGHAVQLYRALSHFQGYRSPGLTPSAGIVVLTPTPAYPQLQLGESSAHEGSPQASGHTSFGYPAPAHVPSLGYAGQQLHDRQGPRRQRAWSGPAAFSNEASESLPSPVYSSSTYTPYPTTSATDPAALDYLSSGQSYVTQAFPSYPVQSMSAHVATSSNPSSHHHSGSLSDFSSVPISQAVATRPYSAHGTHHSPVYTSSPPPIAQAYPSAGTPSSQSHQEMVPSSGTPYASYGRDPASQTSIHTPPSASSEAHSSSLGGALGSYPPS